MIPRSRNGHSVQCDEYESWWTKGKLQVRPAFPALDLAAVCNVNTILRCPTQQAPQLSLCACLQHRVYVLQGAQPC